MFNLIGLVVNVIVFFVVIGLYVKLDEVSRIVHAMTGQPAADDDEGEAQDVTSPPQ